MNDPVYFVNAFAETYFKGNTAAVLIVDDYPPDQAMQSLAREFGFSETAFLRQIGKAEYHIRWFTPEVEVPLCGHATLASAKSLFASRESDTGMLCFTSLSGKLTAKQAGEYIELNFPAETSVAHTVDPAVLLALGTTKAEEVLSARASRNLIVVYADPQDVISLQPDFSQLAKRKDLSYFGIAVTAAGYYDYICRYFAPWEGINEDPVTGSAQTFLAPYWAERLQKSVLKGYQASTRGGVFEVEFEGNRVLIRGKAFIYLQGQLDSGWRDQAIPI